MALKPCKECKKEVSSSAKVCPHCGIKDPGVGLKETLLGMAILAVIFGVLFVSCSSSDDEKAADKAARAKTDAECLKDLRCIGEKGVFTAGLKCPREIEKLAKAAVKWTDGTLEPKFSRYRWKDEKAGVVTHIGDKAQFQNGYGAFVNVTYTCDLDMTKGPGEAIHVSVQEGRL